MAELLTEEELTDLTGASQPMKQAEVLRRNGIYYIEKLKGITTTWYHVNHPQPLQPADNEPNFEALDG